MKKHAHSVRIAAICATVCLLVGGAIQSEASAADAPIHPKASERTQVQEALPVESIVAARVVSANALVANSSHLLAASAGHTLADGTRTKLAAAVGAATADIARAAGDVGAFAAAAAIPDGSRDAHSFAAEMAVELRDLGRLERDSAELSRSNAAVSASEVARSKQLHAAAQRAAAAVYLERVWTSGFQAQVNACRGAVDLTAAYHVRVIGEEWQCGGARFPHQGAIVRLSGVISGVYRVGPVVAVLNAYVAHTSNIPRGYALLYQTCRNGNAHTETFTELIPMN